MDIRLTIPGTPIAKGRPRAVSTGAGARLYTPDKTRSFEAIVRDVAFRAVAGMEPLTGPVRVDMLMVMPRPKRLLRKKDPDGLIWAPVQPDRDNIEKAVLDGLEAVWNNDAQVVDGRCIKVYCERDGRPRVEVRIRSLDGVEPPAWLDETAEVEVPDGG